MIDIEVELGNLNKQIVELDDKAKVAYQSGRLDVEKEIDKQLAPLLDKRVELRQRLIAEYKSAMDLQVGVLKQYENNPIYVGLLGKIAWVTQPTLREITATKHYDKDMIYFKMDGIDGFTGKKQQIKMYLMKSIAKDMHEMLGTALVISERES